MRKNWIAIAVLLLLACIASPALAQPAVFFDDFDGDALLPHWGTGPPSDWDYNVSNSMLNVTDLHYPSSPKGGGNYASMGAPFSSALTDFRADVWMGWDAGQRPQRLEFKINGPGASPIIASIGFRNEIVWGPVPQIFAAAGGLSFAMPAPPPGIHQFTIMRTGAAFNFLLNGLPFANFQDNFGTSAAYAGFFFLGPSSGQFGDFHVDRVQVVPAPAALWLFVVLPFSLKSRQRH